MRFFIDTDDDDRWFIIPTSKRQEWRDWYNDYWDLEKHEAGDWPTPQWAILLNKTPSSVEFTDFILE